MSCLCKNRVCIRCMDLLVDPIGDLRARFLLFTGRSSTDSSIVQRKDGGNCGTFVVGGTHAPRWSVVMGILIPMILDAKQPAEVGV
jgi:hypothetical protein